MSENTSKAMNFRRIYVRSFVYHCIVCMYICIILCDRKIACHKDCKYISILNEGQSIDFHQGGLGLEQKKDQSCTDQENICNY